MAERADSDFRSAGETCAAWHYPAADDSHEGPAGRPCVVMAHGIGGTRDAGLEPFAEGLAEAGFDVLLFDYRNFGDSTGEPRQLGWPPRHRDDYRAAVAHARSIDGVDPGRVALWGTSWSGGHVVYVAAEDPRIAAVISQTPDLDGARTLGEIAKHGGPAALARLTAAGIKDVASSARGRGPIYMPIVAPPGSLAAMATDEADPGYHAIAGPTWRNEITGRVALAEPMNRAIAKIDQVKCPILIQIGDDDSIAPPAAARAAAWKARNSVEVHEYPCNHFAIYVGEWRERALADQIRFLERHLRAGELSGAEKSPAGEAATA